jgi:membrane protein
MRATELGALRVPPQLAGEHEPLIAGELDRRFRDPPQIVTQQREPLDVGAHVGELDPIVLADGEPPRARARRLDRAAPAQRAAAVVDAREQSLLERVGDVGVARERAPASRPGEQLERGLAVAVFEVLARQPMPVSRQQAFAARARDERHRLGGVEHREAVGLAERSAVRARGEFSLPSGRHESMSLPVVRTPPSQYARAWLRAFDDYQRSNRRVGFAVAVVKRFGDDEASQLGALIAYYGFFSLFPLLLVFVTVLGFVLQGDPSAQASVLHSTLSQFPIIGTQLQENVHSLKGSFIALAIGIVGSLLAGLGVTGATQSAFNKIWQIPRRRRLGFLAWRLRGLAMLLLLGVLSIVSTASAGYATGQTHGAVAVVVGVLIALAANLLLFFTVFRMLTAEEIETRDLLPGVILAAVLWQVLQHVGGLYVEHVVRHAKDTSGLFAFVLGLLSWLYLGGQVTLVAAEVNVVRARGLWPRRLL